MLDAWFILITSWVYTFSFFSFKEPYWQSQHHCFLEHWTLPNRSTSLDCYLQNGTNVLLKAHLFSLYTWSLKLWQDIWDRTKVLLGTFWKLDENMGAIGNKKKKQKIPPHQENIWIPRMHVRAFSLVTWNFYFQNCLSTFLTWPIDKGTNYGKDLARLVLISKNLIQFIYTKLGGQNKTKLFPWHHKKEFHSPCVGLLFFVAFHMRFHISILSCNIFSIFIVLVP